MGELENRIRRFIVQKIMLKKDETILKEDDSLIETGVIDSLGINMLVAFIEEETRVAIPEDELYPENFESIKTIAKLVSKLRNTR